MHCIGQPQNFKFCITLQYVAEYKNSSDHAVQVHVIHVGWVLTWLPLVRERLSVDKIKEIRNEKHQMQLAKRHAP